MLAWLVTGKFGHNDRAVVGRGALIWQMGHDCGVIEGAIDRLQLPEESSPSASGGTMSDGRSARLAVPVMLPGIVPLPPRSQALTSTATGVNAISSTVTRPGSN